MLEHLQAEHDVEARVLDGDGVDRAVQVGVRVPRDVEADGVGEELAIGPVAAADVEHALPADVLRAQPVDERLAHRVLDRPTAGLEHGSLGLDSRHSEPECEPGECIERDPGDEPLCAPQPGEQRDPRPAGV